MASIATLGVKEDIEVILKSGGFLRDVELFLNNKFPHVTRGISRRSIRRYCRLHCMRRFSSKNLDKKEKEKAIVEAAREVGPSYGANTLQGYLRTKGIQVSTNTIRNIQKKINPIAFNARKHDLLDKRNPIPYYAPHFGYRGHIDQNEKLVRYGVVHAVLRDGHSGYIESWIILPSKNPIKLYSLFYRPVLVNTGIFDQLRVDMGKEWVLILFIQELLKRQRQDQTRAAHIKTTSKKNLTIERVWPEVNARVNYPIKQILVELEDKGILDMSDETVQFCVSWYTCEVAKVGMAKFVDSWNAHKIKGKLGNGVPSARKQQTNKLLPIQSHHVPTEKDAVLLYEAQGGKLQREWRVGIDPLLGNDAKQLVREQHFHQKYSFDDIFTGVVSGNTKTFKKALKYYIKLTLSLAS